MKLIAADSNPNLSYSADVIGTIEFAEFMEPPNQSETINFTLHMTDLIRQKDEEFKNVLYLMRN